MLHSITLRRRAPIVSALLLAGCMGIAQQGAIDLGYKAMDRHNYEEALRRFATAEKYKEATPAIRAEILFQRGRCYEALGRTLDARGAYRFLIAQYPETQWAYQAKERLAAAEAIPAAPPSTGAP